MPTQLMSATVTARDFLMGSVWEGTGEELHTNRHAAQQSRYGQRILSGISGMLLTIDAYRPELIWAPVSKLQWAFDAPLFEGAGIEVQGSESAGEHSITGIVDGIIASRGAMEIGPPGVSATTPGRATRGRTMTGADVDLFHSWFPRPEADAPGYIPWPMLVLTSSGLVTGSKLFGEFETVLNRGFTWSFSKPLPYEETIHCEVSDVRSRPSASRPGLSVVQFKVAIVSSVSGETFGTAEWVMMCE